MRVGVIGSGDVGRALSRGLARHGHSVVLGTRNPGREDLGAWQASTGANARVGTFEQAALHGEMVILAVHGSAAEAALELAGPSNLAGKLLLDVTNPLDFSAGMPPGLYVGTTDSLGERVQRKVPAAKVVKCFNIIPNSQMIDPHLAGGPPDMIICGNDPAAKRATAELLKGLGWGDPIDIGGIEGSRWLEALVALWLRVGAALGTFDHAFKVLRP